MYCQEPLSLPHTFKSTHDPLSNSRRLMGKFCPAISILTCIGNRIRHEVSMCGPIASQLVNTVAEPSRNMVARSTGG